MKKEKPEYWFCTIGPVVRSKLPFGADGPMRAAVKKAFFQMMKEDARDCSTGWGISEEENKAMLDVRLEAFYKRNNIPATTKRRKLYQFDKCPSKSPHFVNVEPGSPICRGCGYHVSTKNVKEGWLTLCTYKERSKGKDGNRTTKRIKKTKGVL